MRATKIEIFIVKYEGKTNCLHSNYHQLRDLLFAPAGRCS